MKLRLSRSLCVLAVCLGCLVSGPLVFGDSYTYSTTVHSIPQAPLKLPSQARPQP